MGKALTSPDHPNLTDKQTAFAHAYVSNGFNGTEAAIKAGYAPRSAHVQASRMLSDPNVKGLIVALQTKAMEKSAITPDLVIRELGRIGLSDARKVARWGVDEDGNPFSSLRNSEELDDAAAAAIASVKVNSKGGLEFRQHDKIAALGLLARHFGLMEPDVVAHAQVTFVIEGGPPLKIDNSGR